MANKVMELVHDEIVEDIKNLKEYNGDAEALKAEWDNWNDWSNYNDWANWRNWSNWNNWSN